MLAEMTEKILDKELATYQKLLPTLLVEEGKYALVFGDTLVGIYDTYQSALTKGYEVAKLKPFLVKKISGSETVAYFSRDLNQTCLTSRS